jgi:hypothetical protein
MSAPHTRPVPLHRIGGHHSHQQFLPPRLADIRMHAPVSGIRHPTHQQTCGSENRPPTRLSTHHIMATMLFRPVVHRSDTGANTSCARMLWETRCSALLVHPTPRADPSSPPAHAAYKSGRRAFLHQPHLALSRPDSHPEICRTR